MASEERTGLAEAIRALTDPDRRLTADGIATMVGANKPGLYAWFTDPIGAEDLSRGLGGRIMPGLIYAGQTGAGTSSATIRDRVGRNHARGNIRGSTFRLTLAAALARPLRIKVVAFRRTTPDAEARLTEWVGAHLVVAIHPYSDRSQLDAFETRALMTLDPPLNLAKMPTTPIRAALSAARQPFMRRDGTH